MEDQNYSHEIRIPCDIEETIVFGGAEGDDYEALRLKTGGRLGVLIRFNLGETPLTFRTFEDSAEGREEARRFLISWQLLTEADRTFKIHMPTMFCRSCCDSVSS